MKNDYPHIFSPLTVKNMTIKNRIVMMPMGTNYGEQNGEMSFLHINYYEQRAKGGTGLIIVENASIDSPQGSNGTTQLRIDHDNYLPRLFKFCENIIDTEQRSRSRSTMPELPLFLPGSTCSRFPHLTFHPKKAARSRDLFPKTRSFTS